MNKLNEVSFTCQSCKEQYKYQNAQSHECNLPQATCPLSCGHFDKFKGTERLRNHLATECIKVNLFCQLCGGTETLLTLDQHDCVVTLLNGLQLKDEQIKSFKDELKMLREKNEKLTNEVNQLKNRNQGPAEYLNGYNGNIIPLLFSQQNLGPRCINNHIMRLTTLTSTRSILRNGRIFFLGEDLECDECETDIVNGSEYYNCGNESCDWDLCKSCGDKKRQPTF